jgi:hypothetical protein
MVTTTTEAAPATRAAKPDGEKPAKTRRARREADQTAAQPRYFLAKANGDGSNPALDREVSNEGEALVEALRLGVSFYAIQEFRVVPDFAAKIPQLRKEAVSAK